MYTVTSGTISADQIILSLKKIEQMKKKRGNVLVVTGIAILGWIGFLYMNAGASHTGYSSPFVPESTVIVVAEHGADIG